MLSCRRKGRPVLFAVGRWLGQELFNRADRLSFAISVLYGPGFRKATETQLTELSASFGQCQRPFGRTNSQLHSDPYTQSLGRFFRPKTAKPLQLAVITKVILALVTLLYPDFPTIVPAKPLKDL